MKKQAKTVGKKNVFGFLFDGPVRWWDWAIWLGIFLFCFLAFQMRDLAHTVGCSFGYLNGHFADFYDYLAEQGVDDLGAQGLFAGYLPTIYVVFALWNLPMKLFGFGAVPSPAIGTLPIFWSKILPCLAFAASAYLVYRIAKETGFGENKAKLTMFSFLTMPAALFVTAVMGQYESFALLTVLLGTYCWFKKKPFWFVFWFAIGVSLKYTVLLFFLPLLLLGEKNVWKILLQFAAVFALTALEVLLYWRSPAFRAHVFGIGGGADSPVNNVFAASYSTGFELSTGEFRVYLVLLAVALVAVWSYFTTPKNDGERARYAMFFLPLSFAAMFCFTKWHPQWFLLVIPFWTIGAFLSKHTRTWLLLEFLFMVFFTIFNVQYFIYTLDEVMLNRGLLKFFMQNQTVTDSVSMRTFLGFLSADLALSVATALIAIFAVFRHPKFQYEDLNATEPHLLGYVRGRAAAGLLVFLVPAMICFFASL